MVKPASKKHVVTHLVTTFKLSERLACKLVGLSRTAYRYQPKKRQDEPVTARLKELAVEYPRYGYLMLHGLLKREGLVKNKKRTYRLYTEQGLQVRTKKRKKLTRPRVVMDAPTAVNQRWSMDFVSDQLANGRRFRVLNIVDDFSREVVGQLVSVSISGQQVARFLSQIIETRDRPDSIVCDNGTEFTSKAMFFWSKTKGVRLSFIQPGKPTQNAFVESLNGKFRNECLNQHWFRTLDEARYDIKQWQRHYNEERPHSSLNYLPPAEYAKQVA
ncbi:putative transposase [Idiomarinaceae bacterium HL-53]|nr:putative transposase [Idiomarinaceae bacterium HL-53]CUS47654.1 putative transposase [Idiomarinaceae bacterium HL-53]